MFDNVKAGVHAQPEVRRAIERWRRQVPITVKSRVPLLYWLLGEGTPPFKMAPKDAEYGAPPPRAPGQCCGNCAFAYAKVVDPKVVICSQVEGRIQLARWCKLWTPPKA